MCVCVLMKSVRKNKFICVCVIISMCVCVCMFVCVYECVCVDLCAVSLGMTGRRLLTLEKSV